jgi:prepilin-type N-terminal cleavage/methylation domain-containing protein
MARHKLADVRSRKRGFSLLEMMISILILTVVMAVAIDGIMQMEQRKATENSKMDLVSESREFMDQIVNDIHQSGYPTSRMFDPAALAAAPCPAFLAAQLVIGVTNYCPPNMGIGVGGNGLNSVSTTAIQFEADVDGTGVSEVFIQLAQSNGANAPACTAPPCIIQRGTISKQSWLNGNNPLYYTELSDVMNTNVFAAYDNGGNAVTLPATTQAGLVNITDIGITLNVKAIAPDPRSGLYPTATMISDAKIRLN